MNFPDRVERAQLETKPSSLGRPSQQLLILIDRYNLEIEKISEGDVFETMKPRNKKELSWLISAAECMNFEVHERNRNKEVQEEGDWQNALQIYNRAIVILCWIDVMLDDLAEHAKNSDEGAIAFLLFEEIEEEIKARIKGENRKRQPVDPRIKTYYETILSYVDAFIEELEKLPKPHKAAQEIIINGLEDLTDSLMFSATYKLQMEKHPVETMTNYTETGFQTYLDQNSGNMAMGIMLGMFSILLNEDAATSLAPHAKTFSKVGRIGNDCATGVHEILNGQMNGIMYQCRGIDGLDPRDILRLTEDEKKLFSKLIDKEVFEGMLEKRKTILNKLTKDLKISKILQPKDIKTKMDRLLDLELFRINH